MCVDMFLSSANIDRNIPMGMICFVFTALCVYTKDEIRVCNVQHNTISEHNISAQKLRQETLCFLSHLFLFLSVFIFSFLVSRYPSHLHFLFHLFSPHTHTKIPFSKTFSSALDVRQSNIVTNDERM